VPLGSRLTTQTGNGSATSSNGSSSSSNSIATADEGTGSPAFWCGWDAAIDMPADRRPTPEHDQSVEDAIDALEDGDREIRAGSARAALRHTVFRRVFIGAFLSNIGSWMQNVVLGALAYDLTESPSFLGVLLFAQLGPLLLFSMVGGMLADAFDRRRLLVTVSVVQGLLSLALAGVTLSDDPSLVALVGIVFLIGMGQAVFGPTYSALLPALVGKRDLAGAISLNSAQMNGSRVIGPIVGAAVFAGVGESWVFVINALSFLLVIWALLSVRLPAPTPDTSGLRGIRRVLAGFTVAKDDPVVARCLIVIFTFSLLSLPFIGQLPTLADRNLGIAAKSTEYGWLYASFGVGALLGALSIGTVLAARSLERVVRVGLVAFAVFLAGFSLLRSAAPAYPAVLLVGLAYFAVITSLSTVLQQRLDDANRGRVMALWIMGFGGTVPIGNLIAGPLIEATSVTTVVLAGAAIAVGLAAYADLSPAPAVGEDPALAPAE
jgi:MFS family permease